MNSDAATLTVVDDARDEVWQRLRHEAEAGSVAEPVLASYYHAAILNHSDFESAISYQLANLLGSNTVPAMTIREVFQEALTQEPELGEAMRADILAYYERDPACDKYIMPFLYFKGFHSLQAYRVSHWLWQKGRRPLALYFQNQISQSFGVDIHPGAQLGKGIMIDHATGVVIGETVIMGDDVSLLHGVTLGGSGCSSGKRHPTIGHGVMISVGAMVLGNITIGDGVKVGGGSLVLESVPAHTTVAGVPARIVGKPRGDSPALDMDQDLSEQGY